VHGDIRRINLPAMGHKDVHGMTTDIKNDRAEEALRGNLAVPISPSRYRASRRLSRHAFVQKPGSGGGDAHDPSKILSLEELRTPRIFTEIVDRRAASSS